MKHLFSVLFLALTLALSSQNQPLSVDEAIRKGTLPNGLTYYIRHNEQPKQRAEFHIAQNVGAILERDDQQGLAHFLEHMAFNGSEHFPDKGIIDYFEKIGVNFGGNINAYTGFDETVYRLSDVPTIREGIIDTALLTLFDWSNALTLADDEIDKERGVIIEEWRTRENANLRMYRTLAKIKYAGSQYENRLPIGDTAIIKNFKYQTLKDYYKKWYGPDLQAIVVVGDIDVDKIEKKIKDLFGKIPPRPNRGERPIYYLKDNTEPIVAVATDKEAQQSRIQLEYKHKTPPADFLLSAAGYTKSIENNLINTIFGYRFDELALNPDANFIKAFIGYNSINKGTDALYAIAIPKEGKEKNTFKDILSEIEKTIQHGFTNAELTRAKTDILNSYEKSYNERNNVRNITLTREYIRNFLDAEPIPGIAWENNFVKKILPTITKEQLQEVFKSYITENNLIVSFQGSDKPEVQFPTKAETLSIIKSIEDTTFDAPKEEVISTNLVDKMPKAGKIKKKTNMQSFGTQEWILSNGVKVVFKPTEFKKDEILLNAFSWGGLNKVADADLPSASVASDIVQYSGLGKFSYIDLQKALTGKIVSVSPKIAESTENINGSSSVKDFETMLQLIYIGFGEPRRDEKAFQTLMNSYKNSIINREKNPKAIFADTLSMVWTCYDPRTILINNEFLGKINHDKALKIFKQRFAAANDFTFIFTGNINPNDKKTEKLICTWLGSLPKGNTEEYTPQANCHPKGKVIKKFTAKMEIDNSTNAVRYYAPMEYNWENSINMIALSNILDIRYLESIRENEGGSYGVGVAGSVNKLPAGEGLLRIQFDGNPEKAARLLDIVHQEIDRILKGGVRADDLQKTKESLLKDYAENLGKNNYWSSILGTYYLYGRNYIDDYKNAVNAITSESVQNTLKKLVSSGNVFEISMGKEK